MKVKIVLSIAVLAFAVAAGSASGQIEYAKINFQPDAAAVPAGYLKDAGAPFGDRGNGFSYGWDIAVNETRERNNAAAPDKRYDTLNHMQKTVGRYWELAVPNGIYDLFIVCGDPSNVDQTNTLDVEGVLVLDPDGQDNFDEYTLTGIVVSDGRLTIKPGTGSANAKVCFIDVFSGDPTYNPAPVVDAGPDQSAYIDGSIQMNGTVTDEDPEEGDPGVLSWYWYQVSGPGTATFSDTAALDATVTFSAKGDYELMLQATDGDKDANDVMRVRVKDRADEFIVGHWNFEDNVIDQSINSNDGTINALNGGGYDPDAAVGSKSINLINVDPADPNMNYVDLGAAPELNFATTDWTVCGWVKTTQQKGSGEEGKGTIFGNGGDTGGGHRYCLIVSEGSNGQVTLVVDDDVTKVTVQGPTIVNDGSWHFVAGQRDGNVIRLYIDGVLEGTATLPDNYDLSGTSQHNSYIGVITDHDDVAPTLYKHLDGLVDDVRVYNYALALDDEPQYDSILSLTGMGPLVATVDAGEDFIFNWRPGRETQVNGVVTDLGAQNPMTILWSTESGPDDAQAIFANAMSAVTAVGFPKGGVYILKLTVLDEGQEVTDTVQVTVNAPTCADVVADGLIWAADLDGDCYVGLSDLALMLVNWAQCNDPADTANCDWPWLE